MADPIKEPKVGDSVLCFDEEGEEYTVEIDEVGEYDPDSLTWGVTASGDEYTIYWDVDGWVADD